MPTHLPRVKVFIQISSGTVLSTSDTFASQNWTRASWLLPVPYCPSRLKAWLHNLTRPWRTWWPVWWVHPLLSNYKGGPFLCFGTGDRLIRREMHLTASLSKTRAIGDSPTSGIG